MCQSVHGKQKVEIETILHIAEVRETLGQGRGSWGWRVDRFACNLPCTFSVNTILPNFLSSLKPGSFLSFLFTTAMDSEKCHLARMAMKL